MVKICQTGPLKLKCVILPKNAFSGFCQKFSQAMDEVENFFCQFSNPWALRVSGMYGHPQNVKKPKSLHPNILGSVFQLIDVSWRYVVDV